MAKPVADTLSSHSNDILARFSESKFRFYINPANFETELEVLMKRISRYIQTIVLPWSYKWLLPLLPFRPETIYL